MEDSMANKSSSKAKKAQQVKTPSAPVKKAQQEKTHSEPVSVLVRTAQEVRTVGVPISRFVDGSFIVCFTGNRSLADSALGDSIRVGLNPQRLWQFPTPLDKHFSDSVPHTSQFDEHSGWANSWFGHYRAIKLAYEFGYERVLIMEDDCRFLSDRDMVDEIVSNMPADSDFSLLDHFFCKWDDNGKAEYAQLVASSVTPYWHRFSYDFYSAACYMISRRAMERLIWLHESLIDPNTKWRMMRVTDYWHNRGNMGDINMYFCTPNCAIQKNADTEAGRLSSTRGINMYYKNMGVDIGAYAAR